MKGRIVDLETALEPGDKSRFPGPPSTPTQGTLIEIMNAICALEAKVDHLTERVDKHEKYIAHLMQTTHRDTDEYVDPDIFGASTRQKCNPAPRFKTSPNFDESADIYDEQMFSFVRYVSQHYQGPQTDDTSVHTQYPPTNRAERKTRQPRYISPYRSQSSRRGNHQCPGGA